MSFTPTYDPALPCTGSAYICQVAPEFYQYLEIWGDGSEFEILKDSSLVTSDGYDLSLIHFIADSNGDPIPGMGTKGPVLLLDSLTKDHTSWTKEDQPNLPEELFKAGYDVYIGSKRGMPLSRTHQSLDPANADYWDFTADDVGLKDFTTMISAILSKRSTDGDDSKKVQIVSYGYAMSELSIMVSTYPDTAANYIDRIVSQSSCFIQTPAFGLALVGDALADIYDELDTRESDDRRMLKHKKSTPEGKALGHKKPKKDKHSSSSSDSSSSSSETESESSESECSDGDFKDEVKRIKYDELNRDEYRLFYRYIKAWRDNNRYDRSVYCEDGGWEEAIIEALCMVDNERPECQPAIIKALEIIEKQLMDNGIYSLFGPDWDAQLSTVCGLFGPASSVCGYLDQFQTITPRGFKETSVKQLIHAFQQGYEGGQTVYRDDWFDNAWYTPSETYDLSTFSVPLYTSYYNNNLVCDKMVNMKIVDDQITTQQKSTLFTYSGATCDGGMGKTEDPEYGTLRGDLGSEPVDIDLTECTSGCDILDFPWIN